MPKVVYAKYCAYALFKIPKGIDLEDKTVVKDWWISYDVLYIEFVDSTRKMLEIETELDASEFDFEEPDKATIKDGRDYGITDDEEEEE